MPALSIALLLPSDGRSNNRANFSGRSTTFLWGSFLAASACLLAANARAQDRYTLSADRQEVSDSRTGLVWRRCTEGTSFDMGVCAGENRLFSHDEAVLHAAEQARKSRSGWRLPSVKELASIVESGIGDPAIDREVFPSTPASRFWSSTPHEGYAYYSGGMAFRYGDIAYHRREKFRFHVRLVRPAP